MTKDNKNDKDDDNVTKFPKNDRERQKWYADKNKKEYKAPEPPKPPTEKIFNLPPVTQNLGIALIAIHGIFRFLLPTLLPAWKMKVFSLYYSLGFVPARYTGGLPFDWSAIVSPLTYSLLHAGWMHVIMNVGMILVFGALLERMLGAKKMLMVFAVSCIAGALTHLAFYPTTNAPLIGASGGLSGLFGVMLVVMNAQRGGDKKQLMFMIGLWILISLLFGGIGMGDTQNIAWTAHIGGMFGGIALFYYWRKKSYM